MELSTIIIIVDVAGFLGAIAAVIMAMTHAGKLKALVTDMETRNKELEEQHETLVGIEKSISTRYLPAFRFTLARS